MIFASRCPGPPCRTIAARTAGCLPTYDRYEKTTLWICRQRDIGVALEKLAAPIDGDFGKEREDVHLGNLALVYPAKRASLRSI